MTGNKQVGNYTFVTDQPLKAMMQPLHRLCLKTLKSTVHDGKGSEVFACRLPLLGEVTLILSHHQDISTSQHSAIFSCRILSLWLLCFICFLWLAVTVVGRAQAPQQQQLPSCWWRGAAWGQWGDPRTAGARFRGRDRASHLPHPQPDGNGEVTTCELEWDPSYRPVTHRMLCRHQNDLQQNAFNLNCLTGVTFNSTFWFHRRTHCSVRFQSQRGRARLPSLFVFCSLCTVLGI